jgi:hypothetical protein
LAIGLSKALRSQWKGSRRGEFTVTASRRLIAYFSGDRYAEERYFELDRSNKQWIPVAVLNRRSVCTNLFAADGERVLVTPGPRGIGFAWIPLEESTQSITR